MAAVKKIASLSSTQPCLQANEALSGIRLSLGDDITDGGRGREPYMAGKRWRADFGLVKITSGDCQQVGGIIFNYH